MSILLNLHTAEEQLKLFDDSPGKGEVKKEEKPQGRVGFRADWQSIWDEQDDAMYSEYFDWHSTLPAWLSKQWIRRFVIKEDGEQYPIQMLERMSDKQLSGMFKRYYGDALKGQVHTAKREDSLEPTLGGDLGSEQGIPLVNFHSEEDAERFLNATKGLKLNFHWERQGQVVVLNDPRFGSTEVKSYVKGFIDPNEETSYLAGQDMQMMAEAVGKVEKTANQKMTSSSAFIMPNGRLQPVWSHEGWLAEQHRELTEMLDAGWIRISTMSPQEVGLEFSVLDDDSAERIEKFLKVNSFTVVTVDCMDGVKQLKIKDILRDGFWTAFRKAEEGFSYTDESLRYKPYQPQEGVGTDRILPPFASRHTNMTKTALFAGSGVIDPKGNFKTVFTHDNFAEEMGMTPQEVLKAGYVRISVYSLRLVGVQFWEETPEILMRIDNFLVENPYRKVRVEVASKENTYKELSIEDILDFGFEGALHGKAKDREWLPGARKETLTKKADGIFEYDQNAMDAMSDGSRGQQTRSIEYLPQDQKQWWLEYLEKGKKNFPGKKDTVPPESEEGGVSVAGKNAKVKTAGINFVGNYVFYPDGRFEFYKAQIDEHVTYPENWLEWDDRTFGQMMRDGATIGTLWARIDYGWDKEKDIDLGIITYDLEVRNHRGDLSDEQVKKIMDAFGITARPRTRDRGGEEIVMPKDEAINFINGRINILLREGAKKPKGQRDDVGAEEQILEYIENASRFADQGNAGMFAGALYQLMGGGKIYVIMDEAGDVYNVAFFYEDKFYDMMGIVTKEELLDSFQYNGDVDENGVGVKMDLVECNWMDAEYAMPYASAYMDEIISAMMGQESVAEEDDWRKSYNKYMGEYNKWQGEYPEYSSKDWANYKYEPPKDEEITLESLYPDIMQDLAPIFQQYGVGQDILNGLKVIKTHVYAPFYAIMEKQTITLYSLFFGLQEPIRKAKLLHEIAHYIQEKTGTDWGTEEEIKQAIQLETDYKERKITPKEFFEIYLAYPHELKAYKVEVDYLRSQGMADAQIKEQLMADLTADSEAVIDRILQQASMFGFTKKAKRQIYNGITWEEEYTPLLPKKRNFYRWVGHMGDGFTHRYVILRADVPTLENVARVVAQKVDSDSCPSAKYFQDLQEAIDFVGDNFGIDVSNVRLTPVSAGISRRDRDIIGYKLVNDISKALEDTTSILSRVDMFIGGKFNEGEKTPTIFARFIENSWSEDIAFLKGSLGGAEDMHTFIKNMWQRFIPQSWKRDNYIVKNKVIPMANRLLDSGLTANEIRAELQRIAPNNYFVRAMIEHIIYTEIDPTLEGDKENKDVDIDAELSEALEYNTNDTAHLMPLHDMHIPGHREGIIGED